MTKPTFVFYWLDNPAGREASPRQETAKLFRAYRHASTRDLFNFWRKSEGVYYVSRRDCPNLVGVFARSYKPERAV